jgi:hypothetical protein
MFMLVAAGRFFFLMSTPALSFSFASSKSQNGCDFANYLLLNATYYEREKRE